MRDSPEPEGQCPPVPGPPMPGPVWKRNGDGVGAALRCLYTRQEMNRLDWLASRQHAYLYNECRDGAWGRSAQEGTLGLLCRDGAGGRALARLRGAREKQ
jgi:hypothetical protein